MQAVFVCIRKPYNIAVSTYFYMRETYPFNVESPMRLSAPGSGCCPDAPMMERCWRPCNAWRAVGKRHSAGWAGERFPRAVHGRDPLRQ